MSYKNIKLSFANYFPIKLLLLKCLTEVILHWHLHFIVIRDFWCASRCKFICILCKTFWFSLLTILPFFYNCIHIIYYFYLINSVFVFSLFSFCLLEYLRETNIFYSQKYSLFFVFTKVFLIVCRIFSSRFWRANPDVWACSVYLVFKQIEIYLTRS